MTLRIGNKGFTFIEALIAISVLAIGMVGVLRAYSSSVTAMELAQYNIDASCLLKTWMGDTEEEAINNLGTLPGVSIGEFASPFGVEKDGKYASIWKWNKEVKETDFRIEASKKDSAAAAGNADVKPAVKKEDKEGFSLNEVKLTVVNSGRAPARKVSVVTYMEGAALEV